MARDEAPPPGSTAGRRWRRWGWLFAGVWLVFLLDPLLAAWRNPDRSAAGGAVAALSTFAAVYLRTLSLREGRRTAYGWAATMPPATAWTTIGVLAVLALLAVPGAGVDAATCVVFVCVFAIFALPLRRALLLVAAVLAVLAVVGVVVPGAADLLSVAGATALASTAVFGVTSSARRGQQLADAQQDLARLAVVAERGRVARDLHDLLGHSLTVVTLKAQLAARLLEDGGADPGAARARAADEVADVERLARQALTDVRAALAGYREASLGAELASAREALAAAGVTAHLPLAGAVEDVPPAHREALAWALREAVTNVVRHAGARTCWVELGAGGLAVVDDGRGPAAESCAPGPGRPAGSGISGLAERCAAAGLRLETGPRPGGGFALRAAPAAVGPRAAPRPLAR